MDTGPLVAYLDDDERHHEWATQEFMRPDGPLITCEAVVSEAWFLLRRLPRHLARLRAMLADGVFDLSFHLEDEARSISTLMDRYNDMPMSLADACLVRLSELHPKLPLMTLDSDFKVYRRHGRQLIPVICPE
jgi:predicted nucleic acid-binding protein